MRVWCRMVGFGMMGFVSWIAQGNNAADEAGFGRRRVDFLVIDARCNFAGVRGRWCRVILVLHRFSSLSPGLWLIMWKIAGTALDPLVWSAGALPTRRRLVHAVRDRAFLPGPSGQDGECGSLLLLHLSLLMMLGLGHTLSGSWLSGLLS